MKNKKFIFLLVTLVVFVVIIIALVTALSSGGFKRDDGGYEYKIVWNKAEKKAAIGDVMVAHFTTSNDRDSVFFSSYMKGGPIEIPISNSYAVSCLMKLGAGDSGIFHLSTDSLYKSFKPPYIKEHSYITIGVRVDTVMDYNSYMVYRKTGKKGQVQKDDEIISNYLTSKSISASKTSSGMYYTITKNGTGATAKDGDKVSVLYKGTLVNGNVFDASELHGNEPFDFTIGRQEVIAGWDEGLKLLNKGAKGTLFIPSHLGYGSQPMGSQIPANSVLIFDIELLEIK